MSCMNFFTTIYSFFYKYIAHDKNKKKIFFLPLQRKIRS